MGGAKIERSLTPAPRDGQRSIGADGVSGDRLGRRGSLMAMKMRGGEVPVVGVSDGFELKKEYTKMKEGIWEGVRGPNSGSEMNAIAGGSIIRCMIGEPGLLTGCRAAEDEGAVDGDASVLVNKGAAKPTTSDSCGHETQSTTPTRHTEALTLTPSNNSVQPKRPGILRWEHLTAKYGSSEPFETHPANAGFTIATDEQHNNSSLAGRRQTGMDPPSSPHARMAIGNIVNAPEARKTPDDQLVEIYTRQAARLREARTQTSMNPSFADNGGNEDNGSSSMDVIRTTFHEAKKHNIAQDALAGKKLVFGENNTLLGAEKDDAAFNQRGYDKPEFMWSKPQAGQFESGATGLESMRSTFASYAHSATPFTFGKSQLPYSFSSLPPGHGTNLVNYNATQKSASSNPFVDLPIPGQNSDISTTPTIAETKPTFSPFSNNQPPGGQPFIFKQPPPQAKPPLCHPQPFRHNIFEFNPMASPKGTPGKRPQSPVKRNNRQAANTISVRGAPKLGTPGGGLEPPVQMMDKSMSPGKRKHVDTGLKTKSPPHKVARAKNVTASAAFTQEVADDTEDEVEEGPKTKFKITAPVKKIAKKEGPKSKALIQCIEKQNGPTSKTLAQSVDKQEGTQSKAGVQPLVDPYNSKNQANNVEKSLQKTPGNNEQGAQPIDGAGMRFHIYSVNTSTQSYGTIDANGRMPYYHPVGHAFHLFDLNTDICDQKERLALRPEAFVKIRHAGSRMVVAQQVGRYVETMIIVLGNGFDSGEVVDMLRVCNPSLETQSMSRLVFLHFARSNSEDR